LIDWQKIEVFTDSKNIWYPQ